MTEHFAGHKGLNIPIKLGARRTPGRCSTLPKQIVWWVVAAVIREDILTKGTRFLPKGGFEPRKLVSMFLRRQLDGPGGEYPV